ncbi:MAG TPA: hypothetical protein VNZ84_00350 [Methylophilus sp.]|jgi:hypothetical protein|nr:hypothetical protein [Methylophilus sp.]
MSKKLLDSKDDILPNPASLVFVENGFLLMTMGDAQAEVVD